ncbi:polyadenylate-binding protein 8-like [Olea europaea var. sylvestris]|uniref:polyadenylate-binding protein 8-like n=1 Tax=Olea europaea var. sylvestris TaxID=158386 RepID=UPI000C1CD0E1|nr:polyadenylate-binding protein 8-like [Olea europaea var. sylvestris]
MAAITDGGSQPVTALYVGDLDPNLTESELKEVFSQKGDVISVKVCMDHTTERSLGYGYVNFSNPQDAERALKELNFTNLNGKPIRISYSNRDSSSRRNSAANIFVKNLDIAIDNKVLYEIFSLFGNVVSSKVETDVSGQSKGYGFVQYDTEEAAQKAIEQNGMLLNGKEVYVGHFVSKQERENKTNFTNVFVKNMSESITEEDMKKIFGEFGSITSMVVMRDEDGNSKCFGFVNFENAADAAKCVESLNGKKFDDKEWYVGRAKKKSERERELRLQLEQAEKEATERSLGLNNLYIKNLDDTIDDDKLKDLFSQFGVVTSCKVTCDAKGIRKGSGFVAFSTREEASRAISEMNKKMIGSKPLYVAIAERKEVRTARLQAQFSQMRPITPVTPHMPMYTPGSPGPRQQIYYGHAGPSIISPMFVPGMRSIGSFMPNMVQPGQPGSYPGGRRSSVDSVQQSLQPFPMTQQQVISRGRAYRYPLPNVSVQGFSGPDMLSLPRDRGSPQLRDARISQSIPVQTLASALANAPPSEHRIMLGENLYPLIQQLEPESAAKVTGMLLEMDQTEVLHLMESPEALKAKVAEAMQVLRNAPQHEASSLDEQVASLALNE